jgi:hypothetical protein
VTKDKTEIEEMENRKQGTLKEVLNSSVTVYSSFTNACTKKKALGVLGKL